MTPSITLGIRAMDDDHAALEELLRTVGAAPDRKLPALFETIAREVHAHFAREEALMRQHRLPVLFCHIAQHKRILETISAARLMTDLLDIAALRHFLEDDLPQQLFAHMASVDRVAAELISGRLNKHACESLVLPVSIAG